MARPKKPYRLDKHPRRDNNSGKIKYSLKWNIYFRDHLQIERRLPARSDKSTSEYIAKNIVDIVNLKICNQPLTQELWNFVESQPPKLRFRLTKWGILDSSTNAGFEPLMEFRKVRAKNSNRMRIDVTGGHLFVWQKSMETNERSSHHISESVAKVARVIKGCGFITPSDINGEKCKNWLSDLRDKGKSVSSANSHLGSFKSFTRWMLKTGRISHNPIQHLQPLKKIDKERPRRAFTEYEINRLITATINAPKHHGLTGYVRTLIYRTALGTGWRYNEIYTSKHKDFVFGYEPSITVQAGNAKNKKTATNPLPTQLAKDLERYFTDNPAMPHTKAFSGMWKDAGAAMLKQDLKLAGIEYKTDEGVADFHSLRHTFGTQLARNGVLPQEAQKLMRHSDINLTMNYYTHLQYDDKAKAVSKLPEIKITKPRLAKNGTADVPEKFSANFSKNYVKIPQNKVKSVKQVNHSGGNIGNVSRCIPSSLVHYAPTRPRGLEPLTYGLEIRCSVHKCFSRRVLQA